MEIQFSESYVKAIKDGDHFVMAYYKLIYNSPYTNLTYSFVDYLIDPNKKEKPVGLTNKVEDEFYDLVSSATIYHKAFIDYEESREPVFFYESLNEVGKVQAVLTIFKEYGYDASTLDEELYDMLFSRLFEVINK